MPETPTATLVGPVTLKGVHVRLVPLSLDHVDALVVAANEDRATYDWTWVPRTRDEMAEYVRIALDLGARAEAVPFATTLAGTGRVVGTTRFANFEYLPWPQDNPNHRGPGRPDGVEIGWTWLAASVQRSAVNTEAKWLMLRHAFETWQVRVVRLNTDRRNARSRAAIERIGGQLDGIIRANRVASDGTLRDTAAFSLLASEWPSIDESLRQRLLRS